VIVKIHNEEVMG